MNIRKNSLLLILVLVCVFTSCNSYKSNSQEADTTTTIRAEQVMPGSFNPNSGIKLDNAAIQKFLAEKPLFKAFSKDFDTFYQTNNYNYVWYDNSGLIETAISLVANINDIEQEGVKPDIPYKDSLDLLFNSATEDANILAPDITTELMLTGEYFYYAKKIWEGALNNQAKAINWYLPRKRLSYAALLADNLKTGKISDNEAPVATAQYEGLKAALAKYREIDSTKEIVVPSLKGSSVIKVNGSGPVVAAVRKRLFQLGEMNSADTSANNDRQLAAVVNDLKMRYGIKADSSINNSFISAINVPAKKRAEQIMVNMERLRWIPSDTNSSKEFILVNIPEFMLVYYEDAKPVWRSGVVVGKPMTKTVIFSGELRYVVFSPYWNVPQSIINNEIVPGMRRNKNYLARHNMEWNGGRVRQRPGPSNSLGLVKFLFPNSNNIYLHDTPSKSLFNESSRAFSHGCIRVAKPKDLAMRVLRQYPEWTSAKVDAAMHKGKEQYVTLKRTIPVYIGYFTAFIGEGGKVNFRPDIYKRDDRMLNMLELQ